MLYILGITIGLVVIIMCLSNGLKERQDLISRNKERHSKSGNPQNPENKEANKKKLNEHDYHLLAKVLSVGLVDADPNYLQHLKDYRDLCGSTS
ncbi:hypothetical protein DPEC_G00039270 [Dallia pectoralis]|uniref:Uncharacterized protein n=1 Tax=Dallia pectoralis TaxID=75939 RepID=A0ACC2HF73_DALPE|nr:hypothetical protein DPEC_G00039270 [Dallia pectoralis]